jgi:hypothetical protein
MLNNKAKSLSYYPEGGYNDLSTMEMFNQRHYAGKYRNFWEHRERFFITRYADEIPASACFIKLCFGKTTLQAFKNFLNKKYDL